MSFLRKRPATLVELSEKVGRYIDTEEFLKTKGTGLDDDEAVAKQKHKRPDRGPRKKRKLNQQRGDRDQAPMIFTPLSRPIQEVMVAAKAGNLLKKPNKLRAHPRREIGINTVGSTKIMGTISRIVSSSRLPSREGISPSSSRTVDNRD